MAVLHRIVALLAGKDAAMWRDARGARAQGGFRATRAGTRPGSRLGTRPGTRGNGPRRAPLGPIVGAWIRRLVAAIAARIAKLRDARAAKIHTRATETGIRRAETGGRGGNGLGLTSSLRTDWKQWLGERATVVLRALRALRSRNEPALDPTLPATAQIVAVQHPSATLPERPYDLVLLGTVLALLGLGTIEIYSATAADGLTRFNDATYFLEKQVGFLAIGGFAMWFAARMDYRRLKQWTYPMLAGAMIMLVMTMFTPTLNGARRWIPLGPLTFQPVEVAKLALITYLANSLGRKADQVKTFTVGFVPHLVVCGMMMVVLLKQPDLGSSIVLGCTTLGLLFIAGARISYILLAVLAAAPVGYHMIVGTAWRLQRVLAFFNPEAYANGDAYQYVQARLAMGSGGLFGAGLGGGHQTLGYTPEAHSDFILAPIGEELGWVGVALVLALFGVLVWRGIRAALGARDVFGGYLAFGITLMFGVQALFNVGVVLGIVPNKGITLPLVSCGGSSLVITMFLVGLLFNVGRRTERRVAEPAARDLARKKRMRVRVVVA